MTTGVRQGCLLSPHLFLVVLDWVTRTAYGSAGNDIQWTLMRKLEDLDFADDLALLSHRLQDMQDEVNSLGEVARAGLKISKKKTKVMCTRARQEAPLTIVYFCTWEAKLPSQVELKRTLLQGQEKLDKPLPSFAQSGSLQLSSYVPNCEFSTLTLNLC